MAFALFVSSVAVALAATGTTAEPADAAPSPGGTFTTLTYNVAGLPEGISSAPTPRQRAHEIISCYVNQFDIVNVQEDYNYHAALYDTCNNHPHRTSTTGGVPFGSGLNSMSRFPFADLQRVRWSVCRESTCLGNKGFTQKRVRLAEGVFVDVYNVHAGAGVSERELEGRRANIDQLLGHIAAHSAGNSVIIFGDLNTRWTRQGDNMEEFRARGFRDVWVDLVRGGDYPVKGSPDLACDKPQPTSPNCEVVDKVLYWDNGYTGLKPVSYELRQDAVLDGRQLADHPPVVVRWEYSPSIDLRLSDTLGGPHGMNFNDTSLLPVEPKAQRIAIRAGERVDSVELLLTTGENSRHGGGGGRWRDLWLRADEHITGAELCQEQRTNITTARTRIFYARFFTNQNRSVEGGRRTNECRTFNAPANWGVVGFHGRSGDELDRLGLVYAPVRSTSTLRPPAQFVEIRNRNTNRCLDVAGGVMRPGQNVGVWDCLNVPHHRWYYDDHTGLIRNQSDVNYCLDNSSAFRNGGNAIIWPCTGSAGQRFTYRGDGVIRMRTMPNMVLDAFLDSNNVGTWDFNGGPQQRWTINGADVAPINLVSEHSRKCLDTSWGTGNGTAIYQWTCWGGAPQSLRLVRQGDAATNRYQIVGNHSNKCVSVPGDPNGAAATKRGAQLHLWDCRGSAEVGSRNQVFEIRSLDPVGSRNQIVHTATGLCLDVRGWSMDDGGAIHLWDCHDGANQKWKLRRG